MIKMRIISGKYKGRMLAGFTIDGTRPTQDRVKESIFSMLQEKVKDAVVLDLFAGSGNLGIEALSNGAKETYFIDKNRVAYNTIKKNMDTLKIKNASIYQMDYQKALDFFEQNNIQFDLVFLDPPYKMIILEKILETLEEKGLLKENAWIVLEYETDQTKERYTSLELIKQKKYGYKNVKIYEKQD